MRIVIAGGGLAGLATAFWLRSHASALNLPLELAILETADHPGGWIRSDRHDGFVCDWGPNGFLDSADLALELVGKLELEPQLHRATPLARRRYLYHQGRLHLLPERASQLLTLNLLSRLGRARLLAEPLAAAPPAREESVLEFARRRVGQEAAQLIADAAVSLLFAGDPARLSMPAAFPKLARLEREHGSRLNGWIRRDRANDTREKEAAVGGSALTSFDGGMGTLTTALASRLEPFLQLQSAVTGIERTPEAPVPYRLRRQDGRLEPADAVVLALPAHAAARLLEPLDPSLSQALSGIDFASVAVLNLGFAPRRLRHPLDGLGFFTTRGQGMQVLGCQWTSSLFPAQAPPGHALLRVLLGGTRDPELVEWGDDRLIDLALRDLERALGPMPRPDFVRLLRHRRAIPQYHLGHLERLARIDTRIRQLPGLFLAGNSYRGVGINETLRSAKRAVEEVLAFMKAGGNGG
jgi:oxygen-dependent protoporphyrinogen oxidase